MPLFTSVELCQFFKCSNNYLSCIADCSFVAKLISLLTVYPLITGDKCTCHATLVTCYQLAQFVLKTITHDTPCTWWISWLALERAWSALAGLFLSFLTQMGIETSPLSLRGSKFGTVGSFSVRRSVFPVLARSRSGIQCIHGFKKLNFASV